MPTETSISVEEYLATSYRPDCDYVDGRIEERNLGEFDHSSLQTAIAVYFGSRQQQLGITVVVEQRVQVSPTRYRIPDVCVVLGKTKEQNFRTPPFLCIEVLSPEDRVKRVEERIQDYLRMGVELRVAAGSLATHRLRSDIRNGSSRSESRVLAHGESSARTSARRSLFLAFPPLTRLPI